MWLAGESEEGILRSAGGEQDKECNREDIDHCAFTPTDFVAEIYESWVVIDRDNGGVPGLFAPVAHIPNSRANGDLGAWDPVDFGD